MGNLISSLLCLALGMLLSFLSVHASPSYRFRGSWMNPIAPSQTLDVFLRNDWPKLLTSSAVELENELISLKSKYKSLEERHTSSKAFWIYELVLPAIIFYSLARPVRLLSDLVPFLVGYIGFESLLHKRGVQCYVEDEIAEPFPYPVTYESPEEFFSFWEREKRRIEPALNLRASILHSQEKAAESYKIILFVLAAASLVNLFF